MRQFFRNLTIFGKSVKAESKAVPSTKKISVEEETEKAAAELRQWLDDPENKQRIVEIAKAFDQVMKGQWFDMKDVMNRTNYKSVQSALNILNTFKLSDLLIVEERGQREVFRITITGNNRIKLLEVQEKKFKRQLEEIQKELKELRQFHKA